MPKVICNYKPNQKIPDPVEDACHKRLRQEMLILEYQTSSFLKRTGLRSSEVTLVRLQNGKMYPQWKGAIDLLDKRTPEEKQIVHFPRFD